MHLIPYYFLKSIYYIYRKNNPLYTEDPALWVLLVFLFVDYFIMKRALLCPDTSKKYPEFPKQTAVLRAGLGRSWEKHSCCKSSI